MCSFLSYLLGDSMNKIAGWVLGALSIVLAVFGYGKMKEREGEIKASHKSTEEALERSEEAKENDKEISNLTSDDVKRSKWMRRED